MKLVPIILHLRSKNTHFGTMVGGSAELDIAIKNTLKRDMAYVVPLSDECPPNNYDSGINQQITERFGVVVALGNDLSDADKTGITAYNKLDNIRSELFKCLLGWQIVGAESLLYYVGGRFVIIQNDYLWWEFDFEFRSRLTMFDGYCDVQQEENQTAGEIKPNLQVSQIADFEKISTEYILWPHADLPWKGSVPVDDASITDMKTWVDLTHNPDDGAFDRAYGSEFDFYRILNRRYDPK